MKLLKKYLITLAIGFGLVALIAWSKDILGQTSRVDIFHILCDCFFAIGVVITSSGLLVFSSNEGTFDGLVYGVGTFVDMFRKRSKRKYNTLYDYKESRADKKLSFGYLIISGVFFLAISLVMYLFYRQYR